MARIRMQHPDVSFVGTGGDQMQQAGCRLVRHYRDMAYMGFAAVLANIGKVRRNFVVVKRALLDERPEMLILVDYPSFNLRIAEFCRKHLPDTRIIYYIPPKVWAWKPWRIHRIAALCDEVWGIFPFETQYYKERGYTCTYVGNPTQEEVHEWRMAHPDCRPVLDKPSLVLLPGSRRSEVSHCLPRMLEAARRVAEEQHLRLVITAAPGIEDAFYAPYLKGDETLTRDTYRAVAEAQAAIVNSGTATLETALIGTPQVAVYHVGASWLLGPLRPRFQRYVFPLGFFTLVNIIAGMEVIQELLADDFTAERLYLETTKLLHDCAYADTMRQGYEQVRKMLEASCESI